MGKSESRALASEFQKGVVISALFQTGVAVPGWRCSDEVLADFVARLSGVAASRGSQDISRTERERERERESRATRESAYVSE